MTRDEIVKNVMSHHNLPENIAAGCVGLDGTLDQGKLDLALAARTWGQDPASSADPGLKTALLAELGKAREKRDLQAVLRLRVALAKLGCPNPE